MTCTSCGDKPKGSSKGFPRAVVEINNPESLVLLRKVVIPVSMGTEEDVPPTIGKYFNVILQYEANGHIYLYSSDGIPTAIEANIPQEVLDRIEDLEIDVDVLETGLANETTAREAADSALSSSINSLSSSLSAETEAREQADAALEGSINNLTADLEEEATARETADTALGGRIDTVADNLANETANRISADEDLQADIAAEATARQNADTALQNNITAEATARANADTALNTAIASETTARQEADTNLQNQITQEAQARAAADTAINEAVTSEATARQTADAGLQSQIDAITAGSDVKDIVGTKAELNNYDTSTLGNNDIIKVLQDESENNATTYYRWNATTQQFTLIGEEGPYYTKSQTDTLLNAKQNTLTAGSNVQIVNDTISATDTTYTAGTGLALNGTQFSVDTATVATQSDLTAGLATKQDTLTAGSNVQINNNVISATDTTYSDFTGTDGTAAGAAGLVPAPATTDAGKFLKADGTWDTAGSAINVVQNTGTSTTDVMSQDATTKLIYHNYDATGTGQIAIGNPSPYGQGSNSIVIGFDNNTRADGARSIAIGYKAETNLMDSITIASGTGRSYNNGSAGVVIGSNAVNGNDYSVSLGDSAITTRAGEVNVGAGTSGHGYASSNYRVIGGVHDGIDDHDAVTVGQLNTAIAGAGGPKELTSADYNYPTDNPTGVALWLLEPGVYYRTTTSVRVYLDSSAGGMVNDYRTFVVSPVTGTESKMIYMFSTTGSTTYRARINSGTGAVLSSSTAILDGNTISQSTGTSTTLVMSQKAVTSMVYADPSTKYRVQIGADATTTVDTMSVGHEAYSYGWFATALGAYKARANLRGSTALGSFSGTNSVGEMNIGLPNAKLSEQRDYGYNGSEYRLLTGLYDPQSAHDAATKGYVDGLVGNIASALNVINNGTGA